MRPIREHDAPATDDDTVALVRPSDMPMGEAMHALLLRANPSRIASRAMALLILRQSHFPASHSAGNRFDGRGLARLTRNWRQTG